MLLLDFDFFGFVVCVFWEPKPNESTRLIEWEHEGRDTTLRIGRVTLMVGDERQPRAY